MSGPVPSASLQFSELAKDLHRMGRSGRRKMKRAFEQAGQSALSDARSRAGGWSSRIPGAITLRTVMSQDRVGVQLRVNAQKAPHARPFEGITGRSDEFRHPVFGDRDVPWEPQKVRPFLGPAVRGRAPALRAAVDKAYEDAAREAGFR